MKHTPLKRRTRLRARNPERRQKRHAEQFGPCARMSRLLACVVPICRVAWPRKLEAAHVRSRGAGGLDRANVVGLCWRHHREQHQIGWPAFERRYGLDALVAAGLIAEAVDEHACESWAQIDKAGSVTCAVCGRPTEEPRV